MKNTESLLILFLIVSIMISCKNRSNTSSNNLCDQNKCKIYNEDHIFQDSLFPFDFKGYKTSALLRYFSNNTKVDSTEINNQGFFSRIYSFTDGNSKISFLVKPSDKADAWYYIKTSTIKSNILSFNNAVKIGMSKADFNKMAKMDCQCDTFLIQEGDLATSFYFIFENSSLQKIDIITPEE